MGELGIDAVTREYHDVVRQIESLEGEFDPPADCILPPEYMPEPYRSNERTWCDNMAAIRKPYRQ